MERETRVAVFESEKPAEIQLMKSKLKDAGVESFTNNNYMTFTTTPTASTLKLFVNLADEAKAFEIIDLYLQNSELDIENNLKQ